MRILILLCLCIMIPAASFAGVLYQTDFEDAQDWTAPRPPKGASGYSYPYTWSGYNGGNPIYPPPKKLDNSYLFTMFRAAPSLFSTKVTPLAEIKAGIGRSGGKALQYNVEVSGAYATWTGGTPMNVWLGGTQAAPASYPELYMRFYLKYPADWKSSDDATEPRAMQKVMKFVRYNGYLGDGGNPMLYVAPSGGGRNHPVWSMQWYQYITTLPSSTSYQNVERFSPDYAAGTLVVPSIKMPSLGDWHCYEFRAKMNSAPGVADGIEEVWIDGVKRLSRTDVVFVKAGGSTSMGWNMVEVFDNMNITSHPLADEVTYPLWIDDVVVSTEPIGMGTPAPDTTAPTTAASPAGGTYSGAQTVTLSTEAGATIYYTTNGSAPTTGSAVYSVPLTIGSTTTLKYFARDAAGNNEAVQTATYTITDADPSAPSTPRLRGNLRGSVR